MRRYSADDEERIRVERMVGEWTRSGLLDAMQGERLGAELHVELRRTNPFLRVVLALFTGLIIAALVALLITLLDASTGVAIAVITGIAALGYIGLAEYLVVQFRCYRFGIEEALAVAAVVLLCISAAELTSWLVLGSRVAVVVALLAGAAGGFGLYRRFGLVYAACAAIVCAAAIPFQLNLSMAMQRVVAAAVIASVFFVCRSKRLTYRDDYPGDEYARLQAAAWAGVYLALNVHVTGGWPRADGVFYWSTYAVTWVLPLVGVRMAIRDRDHELLDVSLVLMLVTFLTSKPYLGWTRNAWDPIVLGVVLITVAMAIRRWLTTGPHGERHGFTSTRLLDKDRAVLSLAGTASVIMPPGLAADAAPARAESAASPFSGGRSGGGGGDASF